MAHVLIVEDEEIIRSALKRLLERHQFSVSEAGSVDEACRFELDSFDLIITDLRLPGAEGTDLIQRAPTVPVLIMTSYASMRSAVESMKLGAKDYIAKPFDHENMIETVHRLIRNTATENSSSSGPGRRQGGMGQMLGNCAPMKQLYEQIEKIAPTDVTVLIHGESGTGKELAARAIHERSQRARAPIVSVNCAAIPETLIESELFGHERGAFTGAVAARQGLVEAAEGGTLFLDEIGELPLEAQARLLRVIQEREIRRVGTVHSRKVDVRLVAATHRNLRELVSSGRFREDLYYRLQVIELSIPPLRERGDDIMKLAESLLQQYASDAGWPNNPTLTPSAEEKIRQYQWPGNVRELENAMQRAIILGDPAQSIDTDLLNLPMGRTVRSATAAANDPDASLQGAGVPHDRGTESDDASLEDYFVQFVLEHEDTMSETELAQKLGISRKNLWERRNRLGIPRRKKS